MNAQWATWGRCRTYLNVHSIQNIPYSILNCFLVTKRFLFFFFGKPCHTARKIGSSKNFGLRVHRCHTLRCCKPPFTVSTLINGLSVKGFISNCPFRGPCGMVVTCSALYCSCISFLVSSITQLYDARIACKSKRATFYGRWIHSNVHRLRNVCF